MSIQTLKSRRRNKKNQYETYKRRYNALSSIISKSENLDDNIQRINGNISSCCYDLTTGIKGNGKIQCAYSQFEEKKESNIYGDSTLSNCRTNIINEKSRCLRKMNELECEIRQLEIQIRSQGGTINYWE